MRKIRLRSVLSAMLAILLTAGTLCGCEGAISDNSTYTHDEAVQEIAARVSKIDPVAMKPTLNIYDDADETTVALSDISSFPITVQGNGEVDIEIAAATELSADTPDDLINVWAKNFNNQKNQVNGKTASVSIRKITSGDALTHITEGDYRPEAYLPSNFAWGKMLEAKGFELSALTDRLVGNTAGILMKQETYDTYIAKYDEVTMDKVLNASLAGDITLAMPNPYTSSSGLNSLTMMLYSFDSSNPLSDKASQKLLEYQRQDPPMAPTTAVIVGWAERGVITAMVMEEQAYHNKPTLKDFVYVPMGIRHDHPFYIFDYATKDQLAVAEAFVEYCLSNEAQKIANEKGFNLHDDYEAQDTGLDGAGYLAAQKIWKLNKDGGKPVVAVFVADVSSSMDGTPIRALKESLTSAANFISSDNYIGLVSFSSKVYIDLPIDQFDATQRAYFTSAVKTLDKGGVTATYDAVLVALNMLNEAAKELPEAKMMIFVLSDGAEMGSTYSLNSIKGLVRGIEVPIYTIGYNLEGTGDGARNDLMTLSGINEATLIDANSNTIIDQLRELFNVSM